MRDKGNCAKTLVMFVNLFSEFHYHGIHQMIMEAVISLATLLKLVTLALTAGDKFQATVQNVRLLLKV